MNITSEQLAQLHSTQSALSPDPTIWRRGPNVKWAGSEDAAHTWEHKLIPLQILRSVSLWNGETWIHVSVSRPDRLPSWDELSKVKDSFIGKNAEAYQVLAAAKDHVNIHAFCLHLWAPADRRRRVANLQELSWEGGI